MLHLVAAVQPVILVALFMGLWRPLAAGPPCNETVVIDSVEHSVPALWCERKIDAATIAQPADLVRLPDNLCHRDFRIYVTPETRAAFVTMAEAADEDGVHLRVKSGFRSLGYQGKIIKRRLARGQTFEQAARWVAPPGYSEHHTGCAVDLVCDSGFYGDSEDYRWLRENGTRFGFVETYFMNNPDSLPWEPWHWAYRGEASADER